MAGTIVNATKSAVNGIIDKIDSNLSVYSQYVGKVTARLQSLDSSSAKSFDTIYNKMAGLSTSQYVSQKTLYENIDRLSSEGISYNIEERAFLASLADKMVNSFDVSNATLTRLIRLYQEDFTQAMLGSEAWLTQVFNMMYEDTSYLKNVDDNILSALTEVMSTMDRSDALTFQYEVQKWLGSMYEVGMSSDAISQLASALNALGTGNAAGFESSGVGTLLNLAIARSNYSLADILTQGLTGEAANEILKSVVELLIDIKDNTSNQATLNAYANVMGVSMADIRGAYNLKSDIPYLYNQTMTLDAAEDEIYNQLIEIKHNRTAMQERIDNLIDNLAVGIATNTAKSDTGYLTWLLGKSLVNIGSQIPGLVGAGVSIAGYLPLLANIAGGIKTINSSSLGWMSTVDSGYDNAENAEGTKAGILGIFNEIGSFISNAASPTIGDLIGFLTGNTKRSVISQRGNAYGIVKPNYGTVSTNISSSYGYSGITSTEDLYNGTVLATNAPTSGLQNLETLASQSGFGYDVFSTESNNEGYNEYDIIQELFYHQEHPIKVHLAYFDEDAEKQLIDYINNQDNNDQLQKIRGKVEGTITVDTEEFGVGDIQRIISAVQSAG